MKKISCIIPAYNEGPRIKNVLGVAISHPMIDEVVVVNDGSTDDTAQVISATIHLQILGQNKVRFINKKINQGKSRAIYDGVKESTGDFVFFLDSDLVGLNQDNISDLLNPILSGKADVSMSLRRNAPGLWHRIGIDYISGERVFPKSMLDGHIDDIPKLRPFGLEVFLNRLILEKNLRIKIVNWNNVDSPYKYKKVGWYKGLKSDIKMIYDIFKTVGFFGPVYEIVKMRKLRVD